MLLRNSRILVVEDEFLIALELEACLRGAGASVIGPSATVSAALERAEETDLSAAILDVRLGSESVAPVARHLVSRATPFLFYTGQVHIDPFFRDWPDIPVVRKPASSDALVAAVARLLATARHPHRAKTIGVR
jgi:DNA-binding NtrC family response regulator